MEMVGFFVRLSSSLLWFQIYRLGASVVDTSLPREPDSGLRNSFLNPPTPAIDRQCSGAEEILGGSIYDHAYYASLFEEAEAQSNLSSPNATQVTLVYTGVWDKSLTQSVQFFFFFVAESLFS